MKRRDLAVAIHHLDKIPGPRERHRNELESILLRLIAEVEREERTALGVTVAPS